MEQAFFSFNRGRVSPLSRARVDQRRVAVSAEVMTNFVPRILGPMSLRPGLQFLASSQSNNTARYLDFVFSIDDTALIELTDGAMRVFVDDAVVTRVAVSSAVANPSFTSDVASWTDNDEAGGASVWVTGGYLGLTGNGTAAAIRDQTVTVAAADQGKKHALDIVIERGPVVLSVGSSTGDDDYIGETALETGSHSLAFTPTGDFSIRFLSRLKRQVLVDSCTVASSGAMVLTAPWAEADLPNIRATQSGDIVYVACEGQQQRQIERRGTESWSVVRYAPETGPFRTQNLTTTTITASAISGNVTLTASTGIFRSTNVGSLYEISSIGQTVSQSITAENVFSDPIRVTGTGATQRTFTINISNTFTATVTLQYSLDSETGPWSDVATKSWTAPTVETYNDGLNNQIVWYRIGVKTGDFTSGTADVALTISTGTSTGIARVTGYTSDTVVSAEVIDDLGGTTATEFWSESSWSDRRGWPTCVEFHDGRLWWAGKDKIWGSVSDSFSNFSSLVEGDSGPINRSIGQGPVDTINWLVSLQRLIMGAQGAEHSIRASSLDEPLTPTNFGMRRSSTIGSAPVQAEIIDQNAVYVQRGGYKIYELSFSGEAYDYSSKDITTLVPEIGQPGIVKIAIQRQPDTRIHAVRSDGTVALGVFDNAEEVLAWIDITTDGQIEDAVVLPGQNGQPEDQVYYLVKRTINGSTVRYLEKWAQESEARGDAVNKMGDSFITYTGAATATITGLSHLEGESVTVWANGADIGTNSDYTQAYTVASGQITLPQAYTNVVVGLPYTAQFKSMKLAASDKTIVEALIKEKNLNHLGLVLAWVHAKGLRFGPDFNTLDDMPGIESGAPVDADAIRTTYDEQSIEFPGTWSVNSRICLQAQAPRPCTVLGLVPNMRVLQ